MADLIEKEGDLDNITLEEDGGVLEMEDGTTSGEDATLILKSPFTSILKAII